MKRLFCLLLFVFLLTPVAFAQISITGGTVPCENGEAAGYECENVDLVSLLAYTELGSGPGIPLPPNGTVRINDSWGWTDPVTGREYALVGRIDGVAFVDVTDAENPVMVATIPFAAGGAASFWRDVKVYENHAYIVADLAGQHGVQVVDMNQLRDLVVTPTVLTEVANYSGIASAHNIFINEETGYAYVIGANMGGTTCAGGLHILDLQDPANPQFAGCFDADGYTHDVQCVIYRGPDLDYQGKELCFASNEDTLTIIDVDDKSSLGPDKIIARRSYPNPGYTHQGWLTGDQRFFLQNDETDEQGQGFNTRTVSWDVSDLDDPLVVNEYFGPTPSIDHNMYIVGDLLFQANYRSGLRVLDISNPALPVEVGFFDTVPGNSDALFSGAWNVYPFLASGNLIVSDIEQGLFMLRPRLAVRLAATVFLEGAFDAGTGQMQASPGVELPMSQPFGAAPWSYSGSESVEAGFFAAHPDVVDWVLVELRAAADAAPAARRAAFLLTDGRIVDLDGASDVAFTGLSPQPYFVVVRHRNHLAAMSPTAAAIDGQTLAHDFSDGAAFGGVPLKNLGSVFGLYAGDADANGQVQNDDKNLHWRPQVGQAGYRSADFNLNGQVQTDDKNLFWRGNVGRASAVPEPAPGAAAKRGSAVASAGSIAFSFDNIEATPGALSFDVVATAAPGARLGDTQVYLDYGDAFGTLAGDAGRITATPGPALAAHADYAAPIINDNTTTRVSLASEYTGAPGGGLAFSGDPLVLFHVTLAAVDAEGAASVAFFEPLMEGQQFASDFATSLGDVLADDLLEIALPASLPPVVRAGDAAISMEPAYPNPFNPETTFRFSVAEAGPVQVILFNALGQRVRLLYDGQPEAGAVQTIRLDGTGLASGIYLVRVQSAGALATQRISLMK